MTWKEPKYNQFLSVRIDCRGVWYANLWATTHLEKQHMNNLVFYTYYQQLCALIADRSRITKKVTDMYIKRIIFTADMHRIYINPCGIKNVDWQIGTYHIEPEDIDKIIIDWPKEWKIFTMDLSDSFEEMPKEKDKEKEKIEKKKEKERMSEKCKATQEGQLPHK